MATLSMVSFITVFIVAFLLVTVDSSRQTNHQAELARLDVAAESATALAAHELWSNYLLSLAGTRGSVTTFRQYLDGLEVVNAGPTAANAGAVGTDLVKSLRLPGGHAGGNNLAGIEVDSVHVSRNDDGNRSEVYFTTTVRAMHGNGATQNSVRRAVRQAFVVEGGEWRGLDYALLANNINCIMCHAEIDSVDRYYNQVAADYNSFPRVKVGTLEDLLLRSSAESSVAGTLYVRGRATDKSGAPIVDWAAQTLKSRRFDEAGVLEEDPWGAMFPTDLVDAGGNAYGNLYLDYSLDAASMADGYLPESFPPPFPDDGGIDSVTGAPVASAAGNRFVDPSEFYAASQSADGSLAGGSIFLSNGNAIDTPGELSAALGGGNQASLGASTTGSVVLTGTEANPILLNGEIAIDGDLIIQGYVKGEGSLLVSGNVYIPSDLQYLDGTLADGTSRTFGTGQDGTLNGLALAAGGSVVVGNLFRTKKDQLVTGKPSGAFGFVMSELALFNRKEWAKTQALLPGSGESLSNPGSWTQVNSDYQGADYTPRYYVFSPDGTIPIFNKSVYYDDGTGSWIGKEHGSQWDPATLTYANPSDPSDPLLYNVDGSPKAAVQSLTARNEWVTRALLDTLMSDALATRATGPLKIDGLLYSNNSIFGLVPKASTMGGQMTVNGAIVASDIGLLVPGNKGTVGLQLNYDTRVGDLLKLKSGDNITFRRSLWVGTGAGS